MPIIPPSRSNRRDSRSARPTKSNISVLGRLWFAPPPQPAPEPVKAEAAQAHAVKAGAVQNDPVQAGEQKQSAAEPPKSVAA